MRLLCYPYLLIICSCKEKQCDNLTQNTCSLLPTLLIPADGTTLVGSDAFSCSDKDGDTVTYALSAASTHFEVAAATGELTIKAGAG